MTASDWGRDFLTAFVEGRGASDIGGERLSLLFEAAGVIGWWDWDAAADRFVANPELARRLRLPTEAGGAGAKLESCLRRLEDGDRGRVEVRVRAICGQGGMLEETFRLLDPNGGRSWVRLRGCRHVDERGGVRLIGVAEDVTSQRASDLRKSALLELGDRLRDAGDVKQAVVAAAEIVARALRPMRAGFGTVDEDRETVMLQPDWRAPGAQSVAGLHRFRDYGSHIEDLKRGEITAIADVTRDPRTEAHAEALGGLGVRAMLDIPIREHGRLVLVVFVHHDRPYAWTKAELDFVQTVADRTQAAIGRLRAERRQAQLNRELELRLEERVRAEERLRRSERQMSLALELGGVIGAWDWDLQADVFRVDPGLAGLFGIARPAAGAVQREGVLEPIGPEDRHRAARIIRAHERGEHEYAEEFETDRPDGRRRWVLVRGRCVEDGRGLPARFAGVAVDITERRESEERQRRLMAELDHRVKNVLGVVQALARRSLGPDSPAAAAFTGRVSALAQAHVLLAESRWRGASLSRLAEETVAAHRPADGPGRVRVHGPELRLSPKAAQSLTLILHEMATNAAKHGALSSGDGRLDLRWRVEGEGDARDLVLEWEEADGPPLAGPPERRGFGSTLIERSVAYELDGEIVLDFRPTGLSAVLRAPLARVGEAEAATDGAEAPETRGGAAAPPDARLEGRRVLVVEDEFLIAEQIVEALEAAGAVPVGPAPSVAAAMRLAERETLDAAVLDMNLQGKPVWPVAAAMRARGVPYIFATGYGEIAPPPDEALRAHFIQKPFERADLLAALAALA